MNSCEDLSEFGRSLLTDSATEIALRCGASRIYYSAYHLCQQYASQYCTPLQEDDKKVGGLHAQLFKRLTENSKKPELDELLRNVAEFAKKMKAIRVQADYTLARDFTKTDADRCSAFLDVVKEYCEEVDQVAAVKAE
jgi:hypothetical protein